MQFLESWLKSTINTSLSHIELLNVLIMSGIEVDKMFKVSQKFSKIIIGKIIKKSKKKIFNLLPIYKIDIGFKSLIYAFHNNKYLNIGNKFPIGFYNVKKINFNNSSLMLNVLTLNKILNQKLSYLAQILELPKYSGKSIFLENLFIGENVKNISIFNDNILKIKLTPNRGDYLSVFGISRELSSILNINLDNYLIKKKIIKSELDEILPTKIKSQKLCGRLSGCIIRNININAKTPTWMINRLKYSGFTKNIVIIDIINYVTLELGCPINIFDLDKISNKITIRFGNIGESITLINKKILKINNKIGVISDNKKIINILGISEGYDTSINFNTRNIYLNTLFISPKYIRNIPKNYHCFNEIKSKLERGVDYSILKKCLSRAIELIKKICGGIIGLIDDNIANIPKKKKIKLKLSYINRVLGIKFNKKEINDILKNLYFSFTENNEVFIITPPSYRFDISIKEDIIEEIIRIYGYDNIKKKYPNTKHKITSIKKSINPIHKFRKLLSLRDYHETISYSFVNKIKEMNFSNKDTFIDIINPIKNNLSIMRTTLFNSLINVLCYNIKYSEERIRIFEIGNVFIKHKNNLKKRNEILQKKMIGALAYGPILKKQWGIKNRIVDFFDVKNDIEILLNFIKIDFIKSKHLGLHPGKTAYIKNKDKIIGYIGELHPLLLKSYSLKHPPILFEICLDDLTNKLTNIQYKKISKFPSVRRDISIIIDKNIELKTIEDSIKKIILKKECIFIKKVVLHDLFYDLNSYNFKNKKSFTFRIILQNSYRTLKENEINLSVKILVEHLVKLHNIILRD